MWLLNINHAHLRGVEFRLAKVAAHLAQAHGGYDEANSIQRQKDALRDHHTVPIGGLLRFLWLPWPVLPT